MDTALWIAQGLLAVVFLSAGLLKLVKHKRDLVNRIPVLRYLRPRTIKWIGLLEVLGALGVALPWALDVEPWLTPLAAAGLALTMIVGAAVHMRYEGVRQVPVNVLLLALAVFVAWGRGAG